MADVHADGFDQAYTLEERSAHREARRKQRKQHSIMSMSSRVNHEKEERPTVWWRHLFGGYLSRSKGARVGVDMATGTAAAITKKDTSKPTGPLLRSSHLPIPQRAPNPLSQISHGGRLTKSPDRYFRGDKNHPRRGVTREKLLQGASKRPSVLIVPASPPKSRPRTHHAVRVTDDSENLHSSEESVTDPSDSEPDYLHRVHDGAEEAEAGAEEEEEEGDTGVYVPPPAAPQHRLPTRLKISLSDYDTDSDGDLNSNSISQEQLQRHDSEDLDNELILSPEPTSRSASLLNDDMNYQDTAPLPVTHGEYFEGSLLTPPVERQITHSRISFLRTPQRK